jgi:hypothetical protein
MLQMEAKKQDSIIYVCPVLSQIGMCQQVLTKCLRTVLKFMNISRVVSYARMRQEGGESIFSLWFCLKRLQVIYPFFLVF